VTASFRFWLAVPVALLLVATAAVMFGPVRIPADEVWAALGGAGDSSTIAIVRSVRLPRTLLAALVGAALAMAGSALQGSLRNPLAEPYLLGVSGGAATGAVIAVAMGVRGAAFIPLAAFGGALLAVLVVLLLGRVAGGRSDGRVLLMAGVVVGAFANAAIMVTLANAPANEVRGALWWMMGSVGDADWRQVGWLAGYATVAGVALVAIARDIDLLALGDDSAAALGLNVERAGARVFLIASLLAAATVAAAGLVGFVGLVVPHIVRAFGLRRHREGVLGSALVGAVLVIAADLAARTLRAPAELPLGAVTALIGVPFFLSRLRRLA
jgi:iron complex transport system permease protein